MAVREINAGGIIHGHKVQTIVVDDASDPARSVIVMRRLAGSNVNVIVGGWGSQQVLAHHEIAEEYGIPYIVVGATHPSITNTDNKWTFRVIQNDAVAATQLAHLSQKALHLSRIAVINDSNAYGTGSRNVFKTALEALKEKPVSVQSYQTTDKDFGAQLQIMLAAKPDSIAVFGTVPAAAEVIRQARGLGFTGRMLGTGGLANERLLTIASKAAEGTLVMGLFDEDADAESRNWANRFRREFANGKHPPQPGQAAWQYRALRYIVAPCLDRAGNHRTKTRDCIREFKGGLFGIQGQVSFDATGQLIQPPMVLEVRDGSFQSFKAPR